METAEQKMPTDKEIYVKNRINKILGYVNSNQPDAAQNAPIQKDTELDLYIKDLVDRAKTEPETDAGKEQRQILAKIIRNPFITNPFLDRITQVGSDAGNKILYVIRKIFEEQIDKDPKLNLVIKEYVDDTPNRNNSLLHGYSVELEKKPYTADDEVQFLLRVLGRSMQEQSPNQLPNPNQLPYGIYKRKVALDVKKQPIAAAEGDGRKKGGKSKRSQKRKHRKRSNAKKRGSKKTIKKH